MTSMNKKRLDPALQERIQRLRLPLAPLLPMPRGSVHPAFPKTILAYHLLTEAELDELAHHYHQSTPDSWTTAYPISVLWPRKLSVASAVVTPRSLDQSVRRASAPIPATASQGLAANGIWDALLDTLIADQEQGQTRESRRWSAMMRDDKERIAIKKRKFGKFIGLVDMSTPAAEVESRMRHDLERSVRALRRDRLRHEAEETGRMKMR